MLTNMIKISLILSIISLKQCSEYNENDINLNELKEIKSVWDVINEIIAKVDELTTHEDNDHMLLLNDTDQIKQQFRDIDQSYTDSNSFIETNSGNQTSDDSMTMRMALRAVKSLFNSLFRAINRLIEKTSLLSSRLTSKHKILSNYLNDNILGNYSPIKIFRLQLNDMRRTLASYLN